MIFLLSSGSTALYREDVLRALSGPVGYRLQFRYEEKYVPGADIEHLGSLAGEQGFVCHAAETPTGWTICPVREVKIKRVLRMGSTLSVTFELLNFVTRNYFSVQELQLKSEWDWQKGIPFFFRAAHSFHWEASDSIAVWQKAAQFLASSSDFKTEPVFYAVVGFFRPENYMGESVAHWPASLGSSAEYELVLFHYCPIKVPETNLLVSHGPHLRLYSQPQRKLQSRYDLERFSFVAEGPSWGEIQSWLEISIGSSFTLNLPIRIRSNVKKSVFLLVLIAIALTAGQLTAAKVEDQVGQAIIKLLSNLIAAALVVFGLKKTL